MHLTERDRWIMTAVGAGAVGVFVYLVLLGIAWSTGWVAALGLTWALPLAGGAAAAGLAWPLVRRSIDHDDDFQ